MAANLVTLTATITDGDGDTNTAVANIGGSFKFEDDGPSISLRLRLRDADWLTRRVCDQRTAYFAGLFTPAFGADGFKDADNNDVQDADAITYALGINVARRGLVDTLTNCGTFCVRRAVVAGRRQQAYVFTISVDTDGVVTLDQLRAVRPRRSGRTLTSLALRRRSARRPTWSR